MRKNRAAHLGGRRPKPPGVSKKERKSKISKPSCRKSAQGRKGGPKTEKPNSIELAATARTPSEEEVVEER